MLFLNKAQKKTLRTLLLPSALIKFRNLLNYELEKIHCYEKLSINASALQEVGMVVGMGVDQNIYLC